jgi:hypothetical protein
LQEAAVGGQPQTKRKKNMKRNRIRFYVGAICIALLLTACQSQEAKEVQQQIASIGEVTEESGPLLYGIQAAYEKLSEKDQDSVDCTELTQAIATYNQLCADEVIEQINAIGAVNSNSLSLEQQEKIKEARTAYDDLTGPQQNLVDGEKLTQAEKDYEDGILSGIQRLANTQDSSRKMADIDLMYELYWQMPQSQKDTVDKSIKNSTEMTVADVIEKAEIAVAQKSIEAVTYKKGVPTDAQITELTAAIDDYTALSKSAQAKVENAKSLKSAIEKYNSYRDSNDAYHIRAEYMQASTTVEYRRLLEYASSYKKNKTQFSFEVEIQGTEKGALFLADTVTAVIQGTEDKIYLKDERKEKSHTFQAGDTLTVYGVLDEVKTEKTQQEGSGVFGTNILAKTAEEVEVPVVKITYTSMDNVGVLVSNDPDKDESEYVELEEQREALDEKIKQMPESN